MIRPRDDAMVSDLTPGAGVYTAERGKREPSRLARNSSWISAFVLPVVSGTSAYEKSSETTMMTANGMYA
jgi:hypothetical protein